jgi:hypothetical protein
MARTESHLLQFFFICAICAICGQILFVCISTSEFGLNDRSQVRLESMLEFQSQNPGFSAMGSRGNEAARFFTMP